MRFQAMSEYRTPIAKRSHHNLDSQSELRDIYEGWYVVEITQLRVNLKIYLALENNIVKD